MNLEDTRRSSSSNLPTFLFLLYPFRTPPLLPLLLTFWILTLHDPLYEPLTDALPDHIPLACNFWKQLPFSPSQSIYRSRERIPRDSGG